MDYLVGLYKKHKSPDSPRFVKQVDHDGCKWSGKLVNGNREGIWILQDKYDNEMECGEYHNGVKHGKWFMRNSTWQIIASIWENGKLTKILGEELQYYDDEEPVRYWGHDRPGFKKI